MTLAQIVQEHGLFFYGQDWYHGEAFMDVPEGWPLKMPTSTGPEHNGIVASAVDLAVLFLKNPQAELWKHFLWTGDKDDRGQRIYVGGIGQAKRPGFQIHRHLEVNTEQWRWPLWQ